LTSGTLPRKYQRSCDWATPSRHCGAGDADGFVGLVDRDEARLASLDYTQPSVTFYAGRRVERQGVKAQVVVRDHDRVESAAGADPLINRLAICLEDSGHSYRG